MKEKPKPKVPMPGSCLDDPISGSLRGDPGSGDSERKAEPSAPNFTPTVIDTVGSVGKAEQLGRNHGRKKSSRSTPTTLEISGLPSVVVQGLRGSSHSVCDVGQDGIQSQHKGTVRETKNVTIVNMVISPSFITQI